VDNASRDGTVEAVHARFGEVHVIELERNVGFGSAVNEALSSSDGETIVLVNDDVEVEPGCLDALVAPLERDPRCGMVAGLTTIPQTALIDGFGIELDVTLAAYNRARREPVGSTLLGRLAMPSGGLAAYRRAAIEQAGGFDERLFAYGEDVDLGLRLRLDGWTAGQAPQARGVHMGGASVGVDSDSQRELAGFARGFLLRRYGILRGRAALRTWSFEVLIVGWGLVRYRTLVPLRARVRGWRAARGERLKAPRDAIDPRIGWSETLRRLRHAR
jgi:N-acetylglucosaminyl-diphospho-decaprenol L-rhamnosyltransferase